MSKNSRSGGKFSGNHTTLIDAATEVADLIRKCPSVKKISPGFIKSGLPSANGQRRVKITERKGSILVVVRGNIAQQEIEVFITITEMQPALLYIVEALRGARFNVSFKKQER